MLELERGIDFGIGGRIDFGIERGIDFGIGKKG